jgi:hypothetical protein
MDMSINYKIQLINLNHLKKPIFLIVLANPIVTKIEQTFARGSLVCETIIPFQAHPF